MKKFFLMGLLASGLAFAPLHAEAASSRQQVMVTSTAIGAATGAIIGSNSNQTLEGAIIGGMIGAAAGIILTPQKPATAYRTTYHPQHSYRHAYARPVFHPNRQYRHHAMQYAAYPPAQVRREAEQHANHEYNEHEAHEFLARRHAQYRYQYDVED